MYLNQLKIIGCGGHCKVVLDALSLINDDLQISLCDSNPLLLGTKINGILVDSTPERLTDFPGLIHVAIGNNQVREYISSLKNIKNSLFTIIHPKSIIARTALVGEGSFITAGVILGPESRVGRCCIINHAAVIDHDVTVGDYSHVAPNSTLGGNVRVGKGVLIGAGAVVLPDLTIGDGAIIGAGAVVVKSVAAHSVMKGVPALSKE